ncbi:hypothetical protein D3C78_1414120 [compost metagenome]
MGSNHPLSGPATIAPRDSGRKYRPVWKGESPITNCKRWLSTRLMPIRHPAAAKLAMTADENAGLRKI